MNLVITADDFGLDRGVNAAIIELARARRITAASVMMHRDAVLDGFDELVATGIGVGIHLVLVEEVPRTSGRVLSKVLDAGGRLPATWKTLSRQLLTHRGLADALADEARAQIQAWPRGRLADRGFDFINSHQHAHLLPPLWLALSPVIGATPVRLARGVRASAGRQRLVAAAGQLCSALKPARSDRVLRPWGVNESGHFSEATARPVLSAIAIHPPSTGRSELVVHPGRRTHAMGNRYGHWRFEWERERDFLASSEFLQMLESMNLNPVAPT